MAVCGGVVNHLQVCYDVVGSSGSGFTVRFYVNSVAWGWNDPQVLIIDGSNGTHYEHAYTASSGSGQTKELTRVDIGFPAAPGVVVSFGARATDVFGGGEPRVDGSYGAACSPPGYPITSVDQITPTTARIVVAPPPNNGGCGIDAYEAAVMTNAAFPGQGGNVVASAPGGTFTATGLVPNTIYYYTARAHNGSATDAGWSSWTPVGIFGTPPSPPAAPTIGTVTRVSDTQQTLTWVNHPTGTSPYDNVLVQRAVDGGAYATIATLAGTATSYSDTTTTANHGYGYRVLATNLGGSSQSSSAVLIVTTPAAPSGVTAVRGSGATVDLAWVNNVSIGIPYQVIIEESDGAGGWVAQATLPSGTTTYTDSAPAAGVTSYRIAARSLANPGPVLTSAWVTSPTVAVITPPNAPTPTRPVGGIPVDAAAAQVFTWIHNPVDGSPQRKYRLQYREVGAGTWTVGAIVTSAVSSATIAAGTLTNGKSYEWQVQTWGTATTAGSDGTGASPYSASAQFVTSAVPTATITTPANGSVLGSSTATVTWAYFDAEGTPQAQWRAVLYAGDGTLLETKTGVGAATTTTFATVVQDGGSYRITVEVQDGSGQWSVIGPTSTSTFTVTYLPPAEIIMVVEYDEATGSVSLSMTPTAPVPGVTVEATSVDVERRINGGEWVRIATHIPPNSSIVDTAPVTCGLNEYRLIVHNDVLPSSRIQYHGPTVTVRNLMRNPSGEAGLGFLTADASLTMALTPTGATQGHQAVQVVVTGTPTAFGAVAQAAAAPLPAVGQWFAAALSVTSVSAGAVFLRIVFTGASGFISDALSPALTAAGRLVASAVIPAGTTGIAVGVVPSTSDTAADAPPAGATVVVDGWITASGPDQNTAVTALTPYWDGSTPDDPTTGTDYAWSGTADLSVSTKATSTPWVVDVCDQDGGFLTGGPGFDDIIVLLCDLLVASTTARQKALYHFAGRGWPVEFSGESTDHTLDVQGVVTGDPTTVFDMEAFALTEGIVLWRDPSGRRMYASIGAVKAQQRIVESALIWSVGFTLTQVDYDG